MTPTQILAEPGLGRPRSTPADRVAPPGDYAHLAGFTDGVDGVDGPELQARCARVQEAMRRGGVAALVLEPGADMRYLSGVRWGRSERPFLMVLPDDGSPSWVVPAFEERRAREQLGPDAIVASWHEHQDPFASVVPGSSKAVVVVGSDARAFVYAGLVAHASADRVRIDDAIVARARMCKMPAELARLRRANEATKAALGAVAERTRPGIRQSELAAQVRQAQEAAGLTDVWVLALCGEAASFPHGTHEDRALQPGELVLVDTGGALHGYRSDITRTWALGEPTARARRAWETVRAAQSAATAALRPGVACGDIDAVAREVIAAAGYGAASGYEVFTHRLGHGIGLQVHEPPYLVPGNDQVLQPGMTMSNEPGIYLPGELGVRIEDIVAVTEQGAEIFGPSVEQLTVVEP